MFEKFKKFFKINSLNNKNEEYKTLLDVVDKRYNLDEGIFANINNDIHDLDIYKYSKNIAMSYAYARRTAAAGLFLQGIFQEDDYIRASKIFKMLQIKTYFYNPKDPRNVYFQEKCSLEAEEFLMSYDKRLKKDIVKLLTTIVELHTNRDQLNKIYNYDELIRFLYYFYENQKDKLDL
ncbi:MAG: hypothetical protein IJU76_11685 [Desulfovibrionaceae bacterium]|nr:hypothetical protein [Desulfovibrionaceae bacterium]